MPEVSTHTKCPSIYLPIDSKYTVWECARLCICVRVCVQRPFWKPSSALRRTNDVGRTCHFRYINANTQTCTSDGPFCVFISLYLELFEHYVTSLFCSPTFLSAPSSSLTLIVWLTGSLVWAGELNLQACFTLRSDHLPSDIRGLRRGGSLACVLLNSHEKKNTQTCSWTATCIACLNIVQRYVCIV